MAASLIIKKFLCCNIMLFIHYIKKPLPRCFVHLIFSADAGSEGSYGLIEATHPRRAGPRPRRDGSLRPAGGADDDRSHQYPGSDSDIYWSDNPDRLI